MPYNLPAIAAVVLAALIAPGCGSFHRDWKAASARPVAQGITGSWEGKWISDVNGHNGKLRCLITEQEPGIYQARFHAWFFKILSAGYVVQLVAAPAGTRTAFSGEADLGWFGGGVYRYEGHANATNF